MKRVWAIMVTTFTLSVLMSSYPLTIGCHIWEGIATCIGLSVKYVKLSAV